MSGGDPGSTGLAAFATALLAGHLTVAAPAARPDLPAVPRAPVAAAAHLPGLSGAAPVPDATRTAAALAGPLGDPILGSPLVRVTDAATGRVLFDRRGTAVAAPASTVKTVVATAALQTFAPDERLRTRVLRSGGPSGGRAGGTTLWLVGGGDPTLTAATGPATYPASARLDELAKQVKRSGVTALDRVLGDGSLFAGPTSAPGWKPAYVTGGNVTPISGLIMDDGRRSPTSLGARTTTPDANAAAAFAAALRRNGVRVGTSGTGKAAPGATEVAHVDSPPVPVLVEQLLTTSDNVLAESFGRLVAARRGLPPTFAGATRAVLDVLRELGVPVDGAALSDASGLSTLDRIAPATLVALLRAAADPSHPKLAPLLSGLPVAAFSGTLDERYTRGTDRGAAGEVRAKTGSLSIVTSLAGTVVDKDGRLLLFAFFAPVPESAATKAALDRAATALAGCGCRAPASPSAPAATSSSHPAAPASPDAATPSRPVATPR